MDTFFVYIQVEIVLILISYFIQIVLSKRFILVLFCMLVALTN
jgi:hypothetical protein